MFQELTSQQLLMFGIAFIVVFVLIMVVTIVFILRRKQLDTGLKGKQVKGKRQAVESTQRTKKAGTKRGKQPAAKSKKRGKRRRLPEDEIEESSPGPSPRRRSLTGSTTKTKPPEPKKEEPAKPAAKTTPPPAPKKEEPPARPPQEVHPSSQGSDAIPGIPGDDSGVIQWDFEALKGKQESTSDVDEEAAKATSILRVEDIQRAQQESAAAEEEDSDDELDFGVDSLKEETEVPDTPPSMKSGTKPSSEVPDESMEIDLDELGTLTGDAEAEEAPVEAAPSDESEDDISGALDEIAESIEEETPEEDESPAETPSEEDLELKLADTDDDINLEDLASMASDEAPEDEEHMLELGDDDDDEIGNLVNMLQETDGAAGAEENAADALQEIAEDSEEDEEDEVLVRFDEEDHMEDADEDVDDDEIPGIAGLLDDDDDEDDSLGLEDDSGIADVIGEQEDTSEKEGASGIFGDDWIGDVFEQPDSIFSGMEDDDQPKPKGTRKMKSRGKKPAAKGKKKPSRAAGRGGSEDRTVKKAKRMARTIAGDIKMYHGAKLEEGIENGDITAVLGGEIEKGKAFFLEEMPPELENPLDYFYDGLVEVLANGDQSLISRD